MREQVLDASMVKSIVDVAQMEKGKNYILDWIAFINTPSMIYDRIAFGVPYRSSAPQILLAEEGEAEVTFFHKSYVVRKGELVLKPANTLFSIKSISKNWKMRLIGFRLPQAMQRRFLFFNLSVIELLEPDFQKIKELFDLICEWLEEKEKLSYSIEYLVLALLSLINAISANTNNKEQITRVKALYSAFMEELMKERVFFRRDISFYASRLGVTQKYLGKAVKEVSGQPMMHWINHVSLNAAKEMLRNSKLHIKEIAVKLGFEQFNSFSRFFKKKTGKTPMEYREGL